MNRRNQYRNCLIILILMSCLHSMQALAQQVQIDSLNAYIEQAMRTWEVPGVAIAVIKNGEIAISKGYGFREVGQDDPVDEHTIFAVASHTKSFTAAALAMLVDEGKLKWDDYIIDYLPEFRMYDPYVTRHMSIKDLLTHRSGLASYAADHLWQGSSYSRDEILRRIRYQKPAGEFRIHFGYSNVMYITAGQLIPSIERISWDSFVQERILNPLGMTESTTRIHTLEGRNNLATPHMKIYGKISTVSWYNTDNSAPASGLCSNIREMSQWVKLHLSDGFFNGRQLLSKEVMREILTPQMIVPKEELPIEAEFITYGLGWYLFDYDGRKIILTQGEMDGMRSMTAMVPEEQLGIVVLSNLAPHSLAEAIIYRIIDMYLELPTRDWNAEFLARNIKGLEEETKREKELYDARIKGTQPSLPLERYVGDYIDQLSGNAVVMLKEGSLVFKHNNKYIADLEHWHFNTFLTHWRDPYIALWAGPFVQFSMDETGNIGELRTKFDYEVVFDRVKK